MSHLLLFIEIDFYARFGAHSEYSSASAGSKHVVIDGSDRIGFRAGVPSPANVERDASRARRDSVGDCTRYSVVLFPNNNSPTKSLVCRGRTRMGVPGGDCTEEQ